MDHLTWIMIYFLIYQSSARERIYVQEAQSKLTVPQGFASVGIYYSQANGGWILHFSTFSSSLLQIKIIIRIFILNYVLVHLNVRSLFLLDMYSMLIVQNLEKNEKKSTVNNVIHDIHKFLDIVNAYN